MVPFGPQTAAAIDRYLRARRTHRLAEPAAVAWRGWPDFGYHGSECGAEAPRPGRRVSTGSICICAAHGRHPVAARGRERGWADGRRRVVDPRHDRPLHRRRASERAAAEARNLGWGNCEPHIELSWTQRETFEKALPRNRFGGLSFSLITRRNARRGACWRCTKGKNRTSLVSPRVMSHPVRTDRGVTRTAVDDGRRWTRQQAQLRSRSPLADPETVVGHDNTARPSTELRAGRDHRTVFQAPARPRS